MIEPILRVKKLFYTKPTLVYLTVGYPSVKETFEIAKFLVKNNLAQILEIGFPFSDPIADGEVIQFSSQVALQNKVNFSDIVKVCKELRELSDNVGIFLMGYYNNIFVNFENKVKELRSAGVDGIIIPDITIEEIENISSILSENGMLTVGFVAPNTKKERMSKIVKSSTGFIYLVSSYGTTGVRDDLAWEHLAVKVKDIKSIKDVPVAIGFGIKNREMILKAKEISDGAIVGSAIIDIIRKNPDNYLEKINEFLHL